MKIEDMRLQKGFSVAQINPNTIEALLQYLQLPLNQNYVRNGANETGIVD